MNRYFKIIFAASAMLAFSHSAEAAGVSEAWVDEQLKYCDAQIHKTLERLPSNGKLPRNIPSDGNRWNTTEFDDWTSGFWPGILWYNFEISDKQEDKAVASRYTELLAKLVTPDHEVDHDIGFQMLCSYGNAYRLTGNDDYRRLMLEGAKKLAALYNPKVGTILSWPHMTRSNGWPHNTIMDNMMNLELLFFAARNGAPAEYYNMAVNHAVNTMKHQFRPDYSSAHVALYDGESGDFLKYVTNQGFNDDSMWARGQAWAIYGYTMVYRETGDKTFLRFVEHVADAFLDRLPEDMIPYWDFDDPKIPDTYKDASAAAIAASALVELSNLEDNQAMAQRYEDAATSIIRSLSAAPYRSGNAKPSFIMHSVGNLPGGYEIDASINYADYYYIEALTRLKRGFEGNVDAGPADLVDLYMGVRGNSNCVIGPQLPHGSVNPAPQTPNGGQNGYDENDVIRGFSQLHVSGIGWTRYGQLLLSPQIGFNAKETGHDSPKSREVVSPYYYGVNLDRFGIRTELSPTHHAVAYRFTYPDKKNKTLLLDMTHSTPQHIVPIVKGRFLGGRINREEDGLVTGWGEYAGGFGNEAPYRVYFAIRLDDDNAKVSVSDNGSKALYARIDVDKEILNLGIAVSLQSVDNAKRYLRMEIGDRSLESIRDAARDEWNATLSKIKVGDGSLSQKKLLYTSLYHSLVMPRDRSGDAPDHLQGTHIDDHYCVWDTWRTCYPLLTLLDEDFVAGTVNSFINRLEAHGKVTPTFTASMEWDSKQGGDDVDNIIADAILKNVKGFDRNKAYEIMKHNARNARSAEYLEKGYETGVDKMMSCSYTMEYAYNDDCLARVAAAMGDETTAAEMAQRSRQWENLFCKDKQDNGFTGFIIPKDAEGNFIDIDPAKEFGSWVEYFYEGNSWVYSLFTPGQFDRLIELCGGRQNMIDRLKYGFDNNLITMWNEPGFLAPFIFTHCGRPDLTSKYVGILRNSGFKTNKGYPDNEDSGAMGSWYVWTSLGLFPNAGQDYYYLLPPAFDNISLKMGNGMSLDIRCHKSSPAATCIDHVVVNGQTHRNATVRHDEIANGATLDFYLTEPVNVKTGGNRPGAPKYGVNLAGAEFYHKKMEGDGVLNKDYHYPTVRELDYWHSKGMDLIRLPFKWDRIQRQTGGELSADEVEVIRNLLREAHKRDMSVLIDMHNYGRRHYQGAYRIIGDTLQPSHFADVWARLAREFKDEPGLWGYGLCNEPHDMLPACPWDSIAQVAIDSIRIYDRHTPIVVGGNVWSSAQRWPDVSDMLAGLKDPADNLIFEAHCYFDKDASGIYRKGYDEEEAYPEIGVDRVRPFVEWLKRNGKKGLVGEFGVPADDPRWLECLDKFLAYLHANDVAATYWAAGARWNKYILGIHPENDYGTDRPQVDILKKYR